MEQEASDVVRCLHVIRALLDRVLTSDFGGRRIRFIGDCVYGHLLEGTASATDATATVSTGAICARMLRSSFNLALERLADAEVATDELRLVIGFEYGQKAISRLAAQGSSKVYPLAPVVGAAVDGSDHGACPAAQDIDDPHRFADEWRGLYQPAMERVRSSERPWVELEVLDRENLEALLARHGIEARAIPEAELADLNLAWERLDPWPDAAEGWTRLKRLFAIGPISNGSIAGMMNLARFGDLPCDVILGAEIARSYKPQPETYLRSAEAVGLPPERVAMVAAHNDDLAAARALGLRTVFVRRPREHGPGQTTDLEPASNWDVVAGSLIEVADALG